MMARAHRIRPEFLKIAESAWLDYMYVMDRATKFPEAIFLRERRTADYCLTKHFDEVDDLVKRIEKRNHVEPNPWDHTRRRKKG